VWKEGSTVVNTIDVERKTMSPVTLFAIVAVAIFIVLGIAIAVAM